MAVLRVDHPDIREFITAKNTQGEFTQFNMSVAITQDFLDALAEKKPFELVHVAQPFDENDATQRDDGKWVYETVDPVELWDLIMQQTYDHAEPGVLFIDQANAENNLYYCEVFRATNPCAEQFLPDYGCCCLGSINLTRFVNDPFSVKASFDYESYAQVVSVATRMLDNVLDITSWPLEEQCLEAMNKRRVGQGFTGLGNALTMLGIRYDSFEGRRIGERISETMCHAAYRSSIELAEEKGAFPLFDAEKYLDSQFVKRLPSDIRQGIAEHGVRNSHLLSIAPTGTISVAMADNASNGIEPAFGNFYFRRKRMSDGGHREYPVVDHAFRLFNVMTNDVDPADIDDQDKLKALEEKLPDYFVTALEISVDDHVAMLEVVQPYIDSSISKTVNIPTDYPFDDFKGPYARAAKGGLKGLATFRPNEITGSVLSKESSAGAGNSHEVNLDQSDIDRRLMIHKLPEPVLKSLRWPKRPELPNGNLARTYMVKTDDYSFAVFVGYTENGTNHPFEVWVNGSEQPRGLGAIAKALSMDMRSNDRTFLKAKLDSLERAKGDDGFDLSMPPDGSVVKVPSLVSGFAKLLKYCIDELEDEIHPTGESVGTGATDLVGTALTPMMDALMSPKEPKTGSDGTICWAADVRNHGTGDDFVLSVKELVMPTGQRRPFSVWMSGEYPRVFDGLCKVLSYDMRIFDPAWIGAKLRSLSDFAEPGGDFMARRPGSDKSSTYPSTVAYVASLLIHRYVMLSILDDEGFPVEEAGLMDAEYHNVIALKRSAIEKNAVVGKLCDECQTYSVVPKDGCDFCKCYQRRDFVGIPPF